MENHRFSRDMYRFFSDKVMPQIKSGKNLLSIIALSIGLAAAPSVQAKTVAELVPGYKELTNIIGQSYIPCDTGGKLGKCVRFVYDRNDDGKGDIVEIRKIKQEGKYTIWEEYPYMLIVDNNYDNIIDIVLTDKDRDGNIDKVENVSKQHIAMNSVQN